MRQIRYETMVVGDSNQCSTLRLSDYESRQEKYMTTYELGKYMLKKSHNWIIDGEEIFSQVGALLELLRYMRDECDDLFIHLVTNHYNYYFLRCTSLTDEILDCCDVLTDKDGNTIDLRVTMTDNDITYWEVSV